MSFRSKTPGSSVCEQCGFVSLLSRRSQNVSGRWCVKCGARFCGEASRIDDGTDAGGTTTTNGSGLDSADSGGDVISVIGGGLSANKRKRSQESYSNCSIMRKSDGNDNNLGPSESPEPEPYYVLCCHCNSYFYGHELYEKHFPCPRAPFLLEIQEDERWLESLRKQILNCEDLFERFSKFGDDGRKNLSSQPVAVVENVESVDAKSKSQSGEEATSKSRIFTIPKVTFVTKAPVKPYKLPNSYYNRIQKSNQIRAKARTGKCFVYLESNLVDKQQTGQVKHILALERKVREMLERVELLIIKSNSVFRNSTQNCRNSTVSIVSQVVTKEPQEDGQIEIVNQNKVLEEQQIRPGSEPMEPVLDPLIDEEYSRRILDDRTNLMAPESNHFIINEFASQIPLNSAYYGGGNQNENYYHNDWICRQCFELMTELILRQLDTETVEPINHDFYGDLLSMDANCSLPPYYCAFYSNAIVLEAIESVMNQIMVEVKQEN